MDIKSIFKNFTRHLLRGGDFIHSGLAAMAFETFGISIIEAQACGLPVIGVAGGAMPDRVGTDQGLLGPAGDAKSMAQNITKIWSQGKQNRWGKMHGNMS